MKLTPTIPFYVSSTVYGIVSMHIYIYDMMSHSLIIFYDTYITPLLHTYYILL